MKELIVFIVLNLVFLMHGDSVLAVNPITSPTPTPTKTVDYALPYPGILPDHPLYFLKALRDRILGWVISDPIKKVEFNLLMADKRLAMGSLLFDEGKKDLALTTVSKGEKYFDQAVSNLMIARGVSKDSASVLAVRLNKAAQKHEEVIKDLMSKDIQRQAQWQAFLVLLGRQIQDLEKIK